MPRITVIEATINPLTNASIFQAKRRKVAAYARVSTEQDEQESSYEAQVDRFSEKPLVF